jgi:hypothetical protein
MCDRAACPPAQLLMLLMLLMLMMSLNITTMYSD